MYSRIYTEFISTTHVINNNNWDVKQIQPSVKNIVIVNFQNTGKNN